MARVTLKMGQIDMSSTRIMLAGAFVDLLTQGDAVECVATHARASRSAPLGVISANVDHIHHFGVHGRWQGVLEQAAHCGRIEWLSLLDGAPLVTRARNLTGLAWPRLAGSDVIEPLLDLATGMGITVGFVGGSKATHGLLRDRLAETKPCLKVSGCWAPERQTIYDPIASAALADEIRESGVDMLVVGLGKPRQELWIAQHGRATGAGVLLAFGAAIDFLAGRIERAPLWMSDAGLEWAYRLLREPKRLAHRYLVNGPVAYARLQTHSLAVSPAPTHDQEARGDDIKNDVTAVIVTYNSRDSLAALLSDLERDSAELTIRIVVVDNDSRDGTLEVLADHPTVVAVRAGGNLGYSGGINAARHHLGETDAVLVLNPDLRLESGAVAALHRRLALPGVGVAVPKIQTKDGTIYHSLRREPSVLRGLGDALLGARLPGRPDWASDVDRNRESYQFAHPVDWASGACLMVRRDVAEEVGEWDERYFLYSEEVDYMRRVREAGWSVWFEPDAVVHHEEHGSGQSPELAALQAVNRVRYAERHHGRRYARAVRAVAMLGEAARSGRGADHRTALGYLLHRKRWSSLPSVRRNTAQALEESPQDPWGAVIVPAHNEESVIRSTLAPLEPLAATDKIKLVVAVNGSTDRTAAYASSVAGCRVLNLDRASKTAALNAADAEVGKGARLYLDADIAISPRAVRAVFRSLREGEKPAARPPFRYDVSGSTWPVRAFYRARERMTSTRCHLWGAGVYGLSEAGRSRFDDFPDLVADDLYVDSLFKDDEKLVVDTDPVIVQTPRTVRSLLAVLRRTYGGNRELASKFEGRIRNQQGSGRSLKELLSSTRTPSGLFDATVYAVLVSVARVQSRRPTRRWDRDETSRGQIGQR